MRSIQATTTTSSHTRDLCYCAAFAAVIAVLAQISIPLPAGVPLTLQTLAVPLAGLILGRRRGAMAVLIYLLAGAVGLPVFAGLQGGLHILLGMTGGFLLSFPLMAWAAGFGIESGHMWVGLIAGAIGNYIIGTLWFMVVAHTGLMPALTACVLPFIPTAILKLILSGLLGILLRRALLRADLL